MTPSVRLGMSMTGTGWSAAAKILGRGPFYLLRAQQQALLQEAQFFRTKIVEGLRNQAPGGKPFRPLSPYTIAMRHFLRIKSEKALIERGDLIRNIVVHKIDANNVFVGILRTATNREGQNLSNIGQINEYGAGPFVIKMTPKMRKFLHMVFRKMRIPSSHGGHSKGYIVVTIPPRPFLQPVYDKYGSQDQLDERMKKRMNLLLMGFWAL